MPDPLYGIPTPLLGEGVGQVAGDTATFLQAPTGGWGIGPYPGIVPNPYTLPGYGTPTTVADYGVYPPTIAGTAAYTWTTQTTQAAATTAYYGLYGTQTQTSINPYPGLGLGMAAPYTIQWTQVTAPESLEDAAKRLIRNNLLIRSGRRRQFFVPACTDPAELKARDTLRDMLSEADWRRYVTNGFIMVKGQSNRWYQVFANRQERVRVYEKGKQIASICIHSDQKVPSTDHVINMKLLAELDEQEIWLGGNVATAGPVGYNPVSSPLTVYAEKSLVHAFRDLKLQYGKMAA